MPLPPEHVAIIMDGNGRWARRRGLPRVFGHREGVKAVKRIVTHAAKVDVKYLSLFAFSAENWLRPDDEIKTLMRLLGEFLDKELGNILKQNIRLITSGRTEMLPADLRSMLTEAVDASSQNDRLTLNLCLSYGGRQELIDAAKKYAYRFREDPAVEDNLDENFHRYLFNPDLPDIDLLIRTSGEKRISNFMLWQMAYAELYFTQTLWPGFYEDEFDLAIDEYLTRIRRFGKTDEQVS